jgi:hypothetical protein
MSECRTINDETVEEEEATPFPNDDELVGNMDERSQS